jgi:hypothetical protein
LENFVYFSIKILLFLYANDGDYDKSVKMMIKHYEIRKKAPQLFTNRDALSPELKQSFENQYYGHFPTTPDDHIIIFYGLQNSQAKNFNYIPSTKTFLMMIGKTTCANDIEVHGV